MSRIAARNSACVYLLAAAIAAPAFGDILVWSTGVRLRVHEKLEDIDAQQPIAAVTLVDSEGRLAPVWIRPADLDWEKTRAASEGGAAPTVGAPALVSESLEAKTRGSVPSAAGKAAEAAPSGKVVPHGVRGRSLYGSVLVSGALRNDTSDTIINIQVRAVCLDRRGNPMGSMWGRPKTQALVPGQEVPFEVIVHSVSLRYVEDYKIEVTYDVFQSP